MRSTKQIVEGKILSQMKNYKQSNNLTATAESLETREKGRERHPVYEIFCIIIKQFDPVLLEKLLGVADLLEYLKGLWNRVEKAEEKEKK